MAVKAAQIGGHLPSNVNFSRIKASVDRVQNIIQEVRVDLGLQQLVFQMLLLQGQSHKLLGVFVVDALNAHQRGCQLIQLVLLILRLFRHGGQHTKHRLIAAGFHTQDRLGQQRDTLGDLAGKQDG